MMQKIYSKYGDQRYGWESLVDSRLFYKINMMICLGKAHYAFLDCDPQRVLFKLQKTI
jgi:hypothetical protein